MGASKITENLTLASLVRQNSHYVCHFESRTPRFYEKDTQEVYTLYLISLRDAIAQGSVGGGTGINWRKVP